LVEYCLLQVIGPLGSNAISVDVKYQIVVTINTPGMGADNLKHTAADPVADNRRLTHFTANNDSSPPSTLPGIAHNAQAQHLATDLLPVLVYKAKTAPTMEPMSGVDHRGRFPFVLCA
jgi:hypothetical protein